MKKIKLIFKNQLRELQQYINTVRGITRREQCCPTNTIRYDYRQRSIPTAVVLHIVSCKKCAEVIHLDALTGAPASHFSFMNPLQEWHDECQMSAKRESSNYHLSPTHHDRLIRLQYAIEHAKELVAHLEICPECLNDFEKSRA